MGSWTIVIDGTGSHNNGMAYDIDQMVYDFIQKVKDNGHSIQRAHLTIGGAYLLDAPKENYLVHRFPLKTTETRNPVEQNTQNVKNTIEEFDNLSKNLSSLTANN